MREDFYEEYFRIEDRHWWFVGRRRIVMGMLEAHLTPTNAGRTRRILDFGCGTGTMLKHLRHFGEAQGVDADVRAVAFCHARGEDRVQLVTATGALPFVDNSFDLITALDVLEHIEDDRTALREIARVLRPRGTFLATVPANRWMWGAQDEISHHCRRYRSRELRRRLQEADLDLAYMSYFNTILLPPIAAVRLSRRLRPPPEEVRSDFEMAREGPTNRLLARVLSAEAAWLRRRRLPVGVSLVAVAGAATSSGRSVTPDA